MTALRFGIAGCGTISATHAECLQILERDGIARLVAAAEVDPAKASAFSEKWSVPVHADLAGLLARDDIDAVTICTPSGLHCDQAIDVIKTGRHVLIEKPMDLRVEKVEVAIAAAKERGVTLGGVFQQRFPAGPQKVKRAIEQGYFGEMVFVHCETPWFRSQGYYDSGAWRGTWSLDCGVLSNQAPHMIDRLIWLGGDVDEVLSATCESGRNRNIEAETNAVATIRLKNGALGTITGSTLVYGSMPQRVLICGTEGSASFVADDLVSFQTSKPFEVEPEKPETEIGAGYQARGMEEKGTNPAALWIDSHLANIRDFALAVREGREPAVTGEDGRRLVRVLNLIYEKAGVGPYAK